ncbi:hypothetical protein [Spiroplasma endosymbiont of Amphimallon solstitiale]|uniref:hypothetical protein n=1 Tax=Spiroplasma endosymbiont of Amphimallon solstitiale TaxID=3066288 RepID=UPI00313C6580
MLSFVTLTYKDNMQDIKKAKKDIRLFFLKLKKWWNDPKRAKYFFNYVEKYGWPKIIHQFTLKILFLIKKFVKSNII